VIVARARQWKHVILLTMLVCVLFSQPLAPDHGLFGPMLHDVLVTFALVVVFYVVFESRVDRYVALAMGLVSIGSNWLRHFLPDHGGTALAMVHDSALAIFFGFAVVEILRNIFRQKTIRADDVVGSVCGYLLAGGVWASLYSLVEHAAPGSFTISPSLSLQLDGWHSRQALFDYFSFVTLTTMGYGDVTPIRAPAVSFAWAEAVFGQFYIAVVVAQLVAVRLTQTLRRGDPDSL
jgi:hypothetical protein